MDEFDEMPIGRNHPSVRQPTVRWSLAAAATWVLLALLTRSIALAVICEIALGVLAGVVLLALRASGLSLSTAQLLLQSRPWRDGPTVLRTTAKRFPSLFIRGVQGQVYAPWCVEVLLSPGSTAKVYQVLDPVTVNEILTDYYATAVREHRARVVGDRAVQVTLRSADNVPDGVGVVRRGDEADMPDFIAEFSARDRRTMIDDEHVPADDAGTGRRSGALATSETRGHGGRAGYGPEPPTEVPVPRLTLCTKGSHCSTVQRRATAGRDPDCDLVIAAAKTISRHHGVFTCTDGRWLVENTGRNGIQVNGITIHGQHALADEDIITWGSLDDSPESMVQIADCIRS